MITTHEQSGSYLVVAIEADWDFDSRQERFLKPALPHARKVDQGWETAVKKRGELKRQSEDGESWILAGVADSYKEASFSAHVTAEHIKASPFSVNGDVDTLGYNLFFSPGKKRYAGLKNLRQQMHTETTKTLRDPAVQLAQVMENALNTYKKVDHRTKTHQVAWVTQRGGSAIMTQALRILRDRGIDMGQSQKHFMSNPTSRTDNALKLSREIGMQQDLSSFESHCTLSVDELVSALSGVVSTVYRARHDRDIGYNSFHEARDHLANFGGWKTVVGTVAAGKSIGGAVFSSGAAGGLAATVNTLMSITAPAVALGIGGLANARGVQEFPNIKSAAEYYSQRFA